MPAATPNSDAVRLRMLETTCEELKSAQENYKRKKSRLISTWHRSAMQSNCDMGPLNAFHELGLQAEYAPRLRDAEKWHEPAATSMRCVLSTATHSDLADAGPLETQGYGHFAECTSPRNHTGSPLIVPLPRAHACSHTRRVHGDWLPGRTVTFWVTWFERSGITVS